MISFFGSTEASLESAGDEDKVWLRRQLSLLSKHTDLTTVGSSWLIMLRAVMCLYGADMWLDDNSGALFTDYIATMFMIILSTVHAFPIVRFHSCDMFLCCSPVHVAVPGTADDLGSICPLQNT